MVLQFTSHSIFGIRSRSARSKKLSPYNRCATSDTLYLLRYNSRSGRSGRCCTHSAYTSTKSRLAPR